MKKNILFASGLVLLSSTNSFAIVKESLNHINNNGNFRIGVGANYYNIKEKNGEEENKVKPVFTLGYKYNLKNNFFIDANINFDVADLTSKALFSEVEYCDYEDMLEGECDNPGSYKAKAQGQDIDLNRLIDLNIGYDFQSGFSIFAGVNFYQIDYSYRNHSWEKVSGSLTTVYRPDHVDGGDETAVGFGIGAIYNIKDTNFSTRLMYNQVSFDGGHLDNGGTQKIDHKQVSLTLNYNFL